MSFPPSMIMHNSMPGDVPGDPYQQSTSINPAVGGQDAATRLMLEQASQMEAPQAPTPIAGPLQQFFSLLAANSGANLLRNPQSAQPAQEAVAAEMKKPEQDRIQQHSSFLASRKLRLEAMIRSADNAAKQADAEGKHAQALNLRKKADEHAVDLEKIKHDYRMAEIAARGSEARNTKTTIPGKAAGAPGQEGGGITAKKRGELAARYRAAMNHANGAIEKEAKEQGWSKEDIVTAKGFQKERLSAEYQAHLKGEAVPPAPAPPVYKSSGTNIPKAGGGKYEPSNEQINTTVARFTSKQEALASINNHRAAYSAATYRKIVAAINNHWK